MKNNLTLYAKWETPTAEEYFSWTTTETDATITGLSTTGLEKYNAGELVEIVFPKTYSSGTYVVTNIGASAFSGKNNISKVIIPNNITSIGKSAFKNCGVAAGEFKIA